MNKLVLHIGPHKTASTYIQKMLHSNSEGLRNHGYTYPEQGIVQWGHHRLAELICSNKYDLARELWSELSKSEGNLILSSENFDRFNDQHMAFFVELTKHYQVEIVYVKRNAGDILVSSWQESIKHGGTESWQSYFLSQVIRPFSSEALGGITILNRYAKFFGKDSIKIIDFDLAKQSKDDLFKVFVECLNLDSDKFVFKNEFVNSSLDYAIIETLRILNILYIKDGGKPYHFLREAFLKHIANGSCEKTDAIIEMVRESLQQVNIASSFVFDTIDKGILKDFGDNFYNVGEITDSKGKVYELPKENIFIGMDFSDIKSVLEKVKALI